MKEEGLICSYLAEVNGLKCQGYKGLMLVWIFDWGEMLFTHIKLQARQTIEIRAKNLGQSLITYQIIRYLGTC